MTTQFNPANGLRRSLAGLAWLCAALALPAVLPTIGHAGESRAPAATSARIENGERTTRLIFEMTEPAEGRAFVMVGPDRVIVDLPEIDFRLSPAAGRPKAAFARGGADRRKPALSTPAGLVSSFRFGLFAPGKSRVVVDLGGPARLVRAESENNAAGGGARFVIELAPSDRASFIAAARQRQAQPVAAVQTPPQLQTAAQANAKPLIVLDPGHGGVDSGAHGAKGVLEKDIVFDFARGLAARLEATGKYRVQLTRSSDVFVPLDERVAMGRSGGAALFVSIHADTLSEEAGVSGATVYTVSDKASDKQAARVAEKENQADAVAGFEAGEETGDVGDILMDLTRRETRAYSNSFARTLVGYFKEASRLNKNPHRAAGFRVLKAPDVPSVLLELGYLSSEKDLANLTAPAWLEKAAESVVRAIDHFFQAGARNAGAGLKRGFSEEPEHVASKQR